jgi:DNA polymerase I-like protein with 3'-5' exonuclease and polymerase domains
MFAEELYALYEAPFDVSARSLIIAYYAAAEMLCFLVLGWPLPVNVVDIYAEFRCMTNGRDLPDKRGLLGASACFGLDSMSAAEKEANRELAMKPGQLSVAELKQLVRYCEADVLLALDVYAKLESNVTPHSHIRGEYTKSVARMEHTGVPIDVDALHSIQGHQDQLELALIGSSPVDVLALYDGTRFTTAEFMRLCRLLDIRWPRLASGVPALDKDTFKDMAHVHPIIAEIHQLRRALSQVQTIDLGVGSDGRTHAMLSPFGTVTGRNAPSSTRFPFGLAASMRGLVKPVEGTAIAVVDYAQQEYGVGAALSGDKAMQMSYLSADPYIEAAKLAGIVPASATKESHPFEREQFKMVTLATQYGMGVKTLACRLGCSEVQARAILDTHRKTFPNFWAWQDAALSYAMLNGVIFTTFDWRLHVTRSTKPQTIRNFPCQANGAEILRLACNATLDRGIKLCAPVHDALVIEAPLDGIEDAVIETRATMTEASKIVLSGFPLNTDAKIIRYPDRYMDSRGEAMWNTIMNTIKEIEDDGTKCA